MNTLSLIMLLALTSPQTLNDVNLLLLDGGDNPTLMEDANAPDEQVVGLDGLDSAVALDEDVTNTVAAGPLISDELNANGTSALIENLPIVNDYKLEVANKSQTGQPDDPYKPIEVAVLRCPLGAKAANLNTYNGDGRREVAFAFGGVISA